MKVTLDLDRLLHEQRITAEEHRRLQTLAGEETASLGLNILIAFGVVATAAGFVAMLHSILAAVGVGLLVGLAGVVLIHFRPRVWGVLGSILALVGSVTAGGGIVKFSSGDMMGYIYVMLIFAAGAYFANSGLLAALATLALAGLLGAATAYMHACYILCVERPTLTVAVFGMLSLGAYLVSLRLDVHRRLAVMVSRTSLFLVNMGFWIGSLWGDTLWQQRTSWDFHSGQDVPDGVFIITWALAIVVTGVWAVRENRRWVVNLLAVFGAIHFYSQYFERLGAKPGTLLAAGILALGIALLMARYNKKAPAAPSSANRQAA
jgi:hypothetical protein